jgi:hypothetical protein
MGFTTFQGDINKCSRKINFLFIICDPDVNIITHDFENVMILDKYTNPTA